MPWLFGGAKGGGAFRALLTLPQPPQSGYPVREKSSPVATERMWCTALAERHKAAVQTRVYHRTVY